jgi:hypothetical protein
LAAKKVLKAGFLQAEQFVGKAGPSPV